MEKQYILEFAKKLLMIDSPSGYTKKAIEFLKLEAQTLGFKCELTQKGNLIVHVDGVDSSNKVGVCAHTDTLGLMVKSVNGDGTLSITAIGGPIMNTLDGEYCKVYTRDNKVYHGTILLNNPSAHVNKQSDTAARSCESMHVRLDEVVKNKEDVLKLNISNGDIIAIDPKVTITDSGYIKSRFLDDKISVALLYGVLFHLSKNNIKPAFDTCFMFTVFEEVGHGASWIPSEITSLLAVDMGCIGEGLSCSELDVSICAKDSSGPYDYDMISLLIELSKNNDIQYAVDVYPYYGSDVSAALRSGNNIKGALIGPGVSASHGMERTHIDGVMNTYSLVLNYLKKTS